MRVVQGEQPPRVNHFQLVLGDTGVEFSTWWALLVGAALLVAVGWWLL